jgi:hypothetical protein
LKTCRQLFGMEKKFNYFGNFVLKFLNWTTTIIIGNFKFQLMSTLPYGLPNELQATPKKFHKRYFIDIHPWNLDGFKDSKKKVYELHLIDEIKINIRYFLNEIYFIQRFHEFSWMAFHCIRMASIAHRS